MRTNIWEGIKELIDKYPARFLGILIGLIVGLIIITFGALETSIIVLCMIVGFFIGKSKER